MEKLNKDKIELFDFMIDHSFENIRFTKKKLLINTINPHSYCTAKHDKEFSEALKFSDILYPDGIGIVLAAKILKNQNIKKIAGADIHQYLLQQAHLKSKKVFYLGANQHTLTLIENKVQKQFPNITVSSFSPPYKDEFLESEITLMIQKINYFKPDILFLGMTAPKQEKWAHKYKDDLKVNIICCVGAVFDFYSGSIMRSSPIWIKLGLEWLPRLLKEPKRLFKRNFVSTPRFISEVISFKLFGRGVL